MAIEKPPQSNKIINRLEPNHEEEEESDEISFSNRGRRCCLWIPCLRNYGVEEEEEEEESNKNNYSYSSSTKATRTIRSILLERIRVAEKEDKWWIKGLKPMKKMKNLSEIVIAAGAKWKAFARRFRGKNRNCCNGAGGDVRPSMFHYDPISYSLNFDEGLENDCCAAVVGDDNVDDDCVRRRDFSSRFVNVPASSARSSMDFGEVCVSKA